MIVAQSMNDHKTIESTHCSKQLWEWNIAPEKLQKG